MEQTVSRSYPAILRKWLWLILLVFAATMTAILIRAWLRPPAYRSSVSVQAISLEPAEVPLYTRLNTFIPDQNTDLVLAQFEILVRSSSIAQRTLAETGVRMTADELVGNILVNRDPVGDRTSVSLTAATPEDAEKLLAKQVELVLQEYTRSRVRQSEAMSEFLETELAAADRELDAARAALQQFKLDNGVAYLDQEIQAAQATVGSLRTAQEEAAAQARELETVAETLDRQSQDAQARARAYPADNADGAYWAGLARDLNTQALARRAEAAAARARQTSAFTRLADHETGLRSLITLADRYQRLEGAVKEQQDNRDFVVSKVREAQLKQQQTESVGYLQMIGAPTTPTAQVPTRTLQLALLGGVLSLATGVVLAFLLELLEGSLRRASRGGADGA